jgi:hypothetical protein
LGAAWPARPVSRLTHPPPLRNKCLSCLKPAPKKRPEKEPQVIANVTDAHRFLPRSMAFDPLELQGAGRMPNAVTNNRPTSHTLGAGFKVPDAVIERNKRVANYVAKQGMDHVQSRDAGASRMRAAKVEMPVSPERKPSTPDRAPYGKRVELPRI